MLFIKYLMAFAKVHVIETLLNMLQQAFNQSEKYMYLQKQQ